MAGAEGWIVPASLWPFLGRPAVFPTARSSLELLLGCGKGQSPGCAQGMAPGLQLGLGRDGVAGK